MASTNNVLHEHPDVRFEPSDVKSRNVILTGFGILIGMWIFALMIFVAYRIVQRGSPQSQFHPPPEPRLQTAPRLDYQHFQAWENDQLNHYRWVDKSKGIVAIPIDRAMELIAQRGIPAQKAPAELKLYTPSAGTRDTGFQHPILQESR
jgi:hypothetical protein